MATKDWDPAKPDLWEVRPLDTESIDHFAKEHIHSVLSKIRGREDRLRRAVELADQYAAEEIKQRAERDKVALAIEAHYNVRRGAAMHAAIGVNRTRWLAMRDEGATRRHPKSKADPEQLAKLAYATYQARQMAAYAREVRDDIVRTMSEKGMTNVEIAALIGRNPSQVSHIKYPGRPRPKPRPKAVAVA